MKKKVSMLLLLLLLMSGCTKLNNYSLDSLLPIVLNEKNSKYNVVFEGYKYYVPKGLRLQSKEEYNAVFLSEENETYYFYIDVISFYNQEQLSYKENKKAYYSKKLEYQNHDGYLEIEKVAESDSYFIEFMYNYGKVEAYVKEKNINNAITQMSSLLTSLQFNRTVLETLVGNKVLNYKETTYNVMKPKGKTGNTETYLDYEEKYGIYEGYTPKDTDEDEIEIEDK